MGSLYRTLKRYAGKCQEVAWKYDMCTPGVEEPYNADMAVLNEALMEKMCRFYRENMTFREAVNGKLGVREKAGRYTMQEEMVPPGTTAVVGQMRKVSRELRRITGIRDPLDAPLLGSSERKIERLRERAGAVDSYIAGFAEGIMAAEGRLPNSDELPERKSLCDFINRQVDRLLDMCCSD